MPFKNVRFGHYPDRHYAVHVGWTTAAYPGWLPAGTPVYMWDSGLKDPHHGGPLYPIIRGIFSPGNQYIRQTDPGSSAGFNFDAPERVRQVPYPPPDGWYHESDIPEGTPPPDLGFPPPPPPPPPEEEGPWTEWGMNPRAYALMMKFIEDVVKDLEDHKARIAALEQRH